MSVPDLPPPVGRPQGLGGWLVALFVLVGIVLLLPGLCSLVFMVLMPGGGGGGIALLWLVCFAISGGGIWLIAYALRNRRPASSPG